MSSLYSSFSEYFPCDFAVSAAAFSPDSSFLALSPSPLPSVTIFAYPYRTAFAYIRPNVVCPTTALLFSSNEELVVASGEFLSIWEFRSATLRHSVMLNWPIVALKTSGTLIFARTASCLLLSLESHTLRRPREIGTCKQFDVAAELGLVCLTVDDAVAFFKFPITTVTRTDRSVKGASDVIVIGNFYFLFSLARILVFSILTGEMLHIVDAAMTLEEVGISAFRGFAVVGAAVLAWRSDGKKMRVGVDGSRKFVDGNFRSVERVVASQDGTELMEFDQAGHVTIGNHKIFPIMKKPSRSLTLVFTEEDKDRSQLFLVKFPEIVNMFSGEQSKVELPEFFGEVSAVAAVDRKFLVVGGCTGQVVVYTEMSSPQLISVFAASTPVAVAAIVATSLGEFAVIDETNALSIFSIKGERKLKVRPAVDLLAHRWTLTDSSALKFPTLKYSEDWDVLSGGLSRSSFGAKSEPDQKLQSEILGISVHKESLEFSMERTNFAAIPVALLHKVLSETALGLKCPGGYALLFDWRGDQRRDDWDERNSTMKFPIISHTRRQVPLGAQRRSRSVERLPNEKEEDIVRTKKKSTWNSWMGFLLDIHATRSGDSNGREVMLRPFFVEQTFSFKPLLEGLRSGYGMNRVVAYNHIRHLLREYRQDEQKDRTADSRSVVYFIAMSTELDLRSQLFPAIVDPLLRLTLEGGDKTAEKLCCELYHLIQRRLTGEETQRLLVSLLAAEKADTAPKRTLSAPNLLLTVAEANLDTFVHEIVASEVRKGHVEVLNLLVAIVRRSPRKVFDKIGNFLHGVLRCAEILGATKKTTRELTLLLNVLVEKFPMVAYHKATQRLLGGSLNGEITNFDLRHFHEKSVAKIGSAVSALAISSDGENVACLSGRKISVFRITHHHSFFSSLFKSSPASQAAPVSEFPVSVLEPGHPTSLAFPLDSVRLFWPSDSVIVLIDHHGHEHKFSSTVQ